MLKFINFYELMRYLFDDDKLAQKAAEIIRGLLSHVKSQNFRVAAGNLVDRHLALRRFRGPSPRSLCSG